MDKAPKHILMKYVYCSIISLAQWTKRYASIIRVQNPIKWYVIIMQPAIIIYCRTLASIEGSKARQLYVSVVIEDTEVRAYCSYNASDIVMS